MTATSRNDHGDSSGVVVEVGDDPVYGRFVSLDHGEGYLSLYAYNESLLKEKDDWVEAGETIAVVGASGGRSEPGLYFEIRKGTQPVDPRPWVGRTPPQ